jgi:hypothetical protein
MPRNGLYFPSFEKFMDREKHMNAKMFLTNKYVPCQLIQL